VVYGSQSHTSIVVFCPPSSAASAGNAAPTMSPTTRTAARNCDLRLNLPAPFDISCSPFQRWRSPDVRGGDLPRSLLSAAYSYIWKPLLSWMQTLPAGRRAPLRSGGRTRRESAVPGRDLAPGIADKHIRIV